MSKKFTKEQLVDYVYDCRYEEIVCQSRWSIDYFMIFKHEDKYYGAHYSKGATECQCEYPFDYLKDGDYEECEEYEFKEVMVKKWVKKENE